MAGQSKRKFKKRNIVMIGNQVLVMMRMHVELNHIKVGSIKWGAVETAPVVGCPTSTRALKFSRELTQ
jgi:hypothetical protein